MECRNNTDPLKLVREGTSQEGRAFSALDPSYAPVNGRTPAHEMVFIRNYSAFLRYFNEYNVAVDNWQHFFSEDVSVQLAIAAIQDVEQYKIQVQKLFEFLNNLTNKNNVPGLKDQLGSLFSCLGTLAKQLDVLKNNLPAELVLKASLQNLIKSQLATGFKKLIAYYRAGRTLNLLSEALPAGELRILGGPAVSFAAVITAGLSSDWITGSEPDWQSYLAGIEENQAVFGTGVTVFDQVNHLATHNLFTTVFDQFLKIYARVVADAKQALEATFTNWDSHTPHYALFLAFLRLQEYARQEVNGLTKKHLDFYYRRILQLREKPAQPGHVYLLIELAKNTESYLLKAGTLFKAGKDLSGKDVYFASDTSLVANQAAVAALKAVYRHKNIPGEPLSFQDNRLFASPVINSDDGINAVLTSADQSWHPFYNKVYVDGALTEIRMPQAELGFALASHYLFMAEGERAVEMMISLGGSTARSGVSLATDITCLFTGAEGWIEKTPQTVKQNTPGELQINVALSGDDPAVTAYNAKVHGYGFDTGLPLLLLKLRQDSGQYIYAFYQEAQVQKVSLKVIITGLKTLAVSNDLGPVDTSKPFQPFGPRPDTGSSLIIGSKEIFQKNCTSVKLHISWLTNGVAYSSTAPHNATPPSATVTFLNSGVWQQNETESPFAQTNPVLTLDNSNTAVADQPDFSANSFYNNSSRHGFLRLSINGNFGQTAYTDDLQTYLIGQSKTPSTGTKPTPVPQVPVAQSLSLEYTAAQIIDLSSATAGSFAQRKARFFHIGPFGQAEQHPWLRTERIVYLLPQFNFLRNGARQESEAEFYIGLTGLKPPQNLTLLFQVADGTADPLALKPDPHLHFSYLHNNEWTAFANSALSDQTGGMLNSGIVTLAIPRDASADNTLLATGMHWIRIAVSEKSNAVCRLIMVAAQALQATFSNRQNDPSFAAGILPAGTITKPDQPVAAVKKVIQPFPSLGGRGAEASGAFYTRVSERLRHKDRAMALCDYERLLLEAFPQIYKVKCLNHTHYEPGTSNSQEAIYKELAPGHVTVITIPRQSSPDLSNPLRPFTSLGLLQQVAAFLQKRMSCFVQLHVRNPEFEEVRIDCKVRILAGFDETFYIEKLQQSITGFLSPWAFSGNGSPSFGGKIRESVLINFVEEQPYVDYVTDFQLVHLVGTNPVPKTEVEGSKAVSILVSVPASHHIIQAIKLAEGEMSHEKCICET